MKKPRLKLSIPLAVDFDGTMHHGDLNWMGLRWLMEEHPFAAWRLIFLMLFKGRPAMKLALQDYALRWDWMPQMVWDTRVLALMAQARLQKRPVIVATGSPTRLVLAILDQHGLDYEVLGTESAEINLIRTNKGAALVRLWGERGFDYAGNSPDDLPVWRMAREALVCNASAKVLRLAHRQGNVGRVVPRETF